MIAYYCVEDALSRAVVERLFRELIGDIHLVELLPSQGGFGWIKKKFKTYCEIANRYHVFILTDLDRERCPPGLRREWMEASNLSDPLPSKMSFNIAVAEVEGWILADHKNLSRYLGVPVSAFPRDAQIVDPKEYLLRRVGEYGNRQSRAEMLPAGRSRIGLGYNAYLSRFVTELWDFETASERNASLRRAIERISTASREMP